MFPQFISETTTSVVSSSTFSVISNSSRCASAAPHTKIEPILESITALGHLLQMRVTAEGIETQAQAAYFSKLSCDQLQGYLLGHPLPPSELPAAILKNYATLTSAEVQDVDASGQAVA